MLEIAIIFVMNNVPFSIIFDIGTTTIDTFFEYFYHNQKFLQRKSVLNCQRKFGHDVISRMHSIERDIQNQKKMSILIKQQCLSLIEEFVKENFSEDISFEIQQVIFVGNTIEMHLLTDTETSGMWQFPFTPKKYFNEHYYFSDFFSDALISSHFKKRILTKNTDVFLPQCLDAFIGSDSLLGFYYCFSLCQKSFCFIDIGTNAEIFLYDTKTVYYTSVAAGPAFERNLLYKGVTGSELVDQLAELKKRGILQSDGLLFGGFKDSTEIVSKNQEKIVLTQNIIRQLQLAKAAIHAGIKTLFFESKCTLAQIDTFYISGAFGNALNTENALAIALFPKISKSSFHCIDSTAFEGTQLVLQNKNVFDSFLKQRKFFHVDLAQNEYFAQEYILAMDF